MPPTGLAVSVALLPAQTAGLAGVIETVGPTSTLTVADAGAEEQPLASLTVTL